jgi:hypothetical protein
MANKVTEIYTNLSDEQLREAILEMKEDEKIGLIRSDGWVRRLTKQICDTIGDTNFSTHLFMTQTNLFREAAFRFVK